jgi:hypothetical protein
MSTAAFRGDASQGETKSSRSLLRAVALPT